jgi:hypothetical protein
MNKRGDVQHYDLEFLEWTPETPRKSLDTPDSPEYPGFSTPEFPGFVPETLTHNAAGTIHPNREMLQI